MIDITGPKVSIPAALFILLSPGLLLQLPGTTQLCTLQTSRQAVLFHSLVFLIAYKCVAKLAGVSLTQMDLLVTTILFILLSPGMFLTIPPSSKGILTSGQTSLGAILTHALIMATIFAFVRKTFPRYY